MEHFPPVKTKKDFVRRYKAGEFGNASPTWDTYWEWANDDTNPHDLYHLRNRIAGGETYYNLSPFQVVKKVEWLQERGVNMKQFYVSAMAPTELTLIQGEVQQGVKGLELFWSSVAKPMREALKQEAYQWKGVAVSAILKSNMDWNSWEWLNVLLTRYPGHVVEFSTYDKEWGTVPGYNTVFWEVRKY